MLPQKPFYIIRHGQTEANRLGISAGGQTNTPLNDAGISQAETLMPFLKKLDQKPQIIHHSTMQRAKRTAEILNTELNLQMHENYNLREHDIGDWEGMPWLETLPHFEAKINPPNGETHQQFAQRIQWTLTSILNSSDELPMIVCHGGIFHALGTLYEYGISHIQNCHLHLYEPEGEWDSFPWRVTVFDIEDGALVKNKANFCLSQALSKIA
jgi:broad specificity phosphatase PhoE